LYHTARGGKNSSFIIKHYINIFPQETLKKNLGEIRMLYEFEEKSPEIGKGSFVFDTATIIGNVKIGEGCYIGAGAVLRGDYGRIEIGDYTAIEDNCVVHARPDDLCRVKDHVTIGHAAVLHNCDLSVWGVFGMRAVVDDYA